MPIIKSCFNLQPGNYSSLTAPNLKPTANQERNDRCGNQHHSRELLMMGIIVTETCWAFKKYNKITSGIHLSFFLFFIYHNDARSNKHQSRLLILKYLSLFYTKTEFHYCTHKNTSTVTIRSCIYIYIYIYIYQVTAARDLHVIFVISLSFSLLQVLSTKPFPMFL